MYAGGSGGVVVQPPRSPDAARHHPGDASRGRLSLTREGLAERDRRALESLRAAGIPVCVTLAGGYGHSLAATAAIHAATIAAVATCR